jgi:hypothetical protein
MSDCKESPNGGHEAGKIQYRCSGSDQGKTTWCKWCEKEMTANHTDPSRFSGFDECIEHFLKGDKDED